MLPDAGLAQTRRFTPRYRQRADVIFNLESGEILFERNADKLLCPASEIKMPLLACLFDHIEAGDINPLSVIEIPEEARSDSGLVTGWKSGLAEAPIMDLGMMTGSASLNDAAYALAIMITTLEVNEEKIRRRGYMPGTEAAFCDVILRDKLLSLNLKHTDSTNVTGLPPFLTANPDDIFSISTARELAVLMHHLVTRHKNFMGYFSVPSFHFSDRPPIFSTNNLLENAQGINRLNCEGVRGMKTGYINFSGAHLAAYVERKEGNIGVISLGHPSGFQRDRYVFYLIEKGYEILGQKADPKKEEEIVSEIQNFSSAPPQYFANARLPEWRASSSGLINTHFSPGLIHP